MYRVIKSFRDREDDLYNYREGDVYPREGYEPSEERIAELAGSENATGKRLIVKEEFTENPVDIPTDEVKSEEVVWPKHVGGGYYELSNGEKVRGKEDALSAQAAIGY